MPEIEPLDFLFGKEPLVVVEIGTYLAGSTIYMLEHFNIKKLYTIDPFRLYKGYRQGQMEDYFKLKGEDNMYQEVVKKLIKYTDVQLQLIRDFAHNVVNQFEDEYIDIVWIDGNHTYEHVKQDIEDWFPKVKLGGFLAGDDSTIPEVVRAVKEYFKGIHHIPYNNERDMGTHYQDVFFGNRSWFCKKRESVKIYW